jgi:hypothetical protein
MFVLISIHKNQTRIASNLWNLFWNQNQNQSVLRTEPKIGLLVPFMYENTLNIFTHKIKSVKRKIGDLGVNWRLPRNYWNHKSHHDLWNLYTQSLSGGQFKDAVGNGYA